MKKILSILMVSFVALAMVSCNKDDDNKNTTNNTNNNTTTNNNAGTNTQFTQWMIGTWQVDYASFNGSEETPENMKLYFYANGSGLLNDNGETENNQFGWSITGNTITITLRNNRVLPYTILQMSEDEITFSGTMMPGYDMEGDVIIRMAKIDE